MEKLETRTRKHPEARSHTVYGVYHRLRARQTDELERCDDLEEVVDQSSLPPQLNHRGRQERRGCDHASVT